MILGINKAKTPTRKNINPTLLRNLSQDGKRFAGVISRRGKKKQLNPSPKLTRKQQESTNQSKTCEKIKQNGW